EGKLQRDVKSKNIDLDVVPKPSRGTAVLYSCKGGQFSFESGKLKHGVFFHHVIAGLKKEAKNKKGQVTWGRLSEYVTTNVPPSVNEHVGGGAEQTPQEIKDVIGAPPVLIDGSEEDDVKLEAGEEDYRKGMNLMLGFEDEKVDQEKGLEHLKKASD